MNIVDGPADAAGDRFVAGLESLAAGTLVAPAIPGVQRFLPVVGDLMYRLGKVSPSSGYHPHDPTLAPIWLAAEPIEAVIVPQADLYPGPVLRELDACCRTAGATLWAITDRDLLEATVVSVDDVVDRVLPWQDFRASWSKRRSPVDGDVGPEEEAVTIDTVWEAEHRRLLALSSGPSTDAYVNGFVEAAGWRNERRSSREAIAEKLQGLLAKFDEPRCRVRALRGAEVALRQLGWDLTIDLQRIAGGPPALAGPSRLLNVAVLRHERLPDRAAAVALASVRLAMTEILDLRIEQVDQDGGTLHLAAADVAVPRGLRLFLRAQLLHRARQGATPGEPFITADTAKNPTTLIRVIVGTQERAFETEVADELRSAPGPYERGLIDAGVHLRYTPALDRPRVLPGDLERILFRKGLVDALASVERPARCEVCRLHHEPPSPDGVPLWPPTRNHARVSPDHPWKQNLPGNMQRLLAKVEQGER